MLRDLVRALERPLTQSERVVVVLLIVCLLVPGFVWLLSTVD